jgi:hypothetical protein
MYYAGMTHSMNMANGKVEYGHGGFDDRIALLPFTPY